MMTKRHEDILSNLATIAAGIKPVGKMRLAAALAYRGKIVSIGTNERKTHPLAAKYAKNPMANYLHAEVSAIKNALRTHDLDDIRRSTLYVCRVKHPSPADKSWVWGLSCPCEGCTQAIIDFDISRVVYSDEGIGNYQLM